MRLPAITIGLSTPRKSALFVASSAAHAGRASKSYRNGIRPPANARHLKRRSAAVRGSLIVVKIWVAVGVALVQAVRSATGRCPSAQSLTA